MKNVATAYLNYLKNTSTNAAEYIQDTAKTLFATQCIKAINGTIICSSAEEITVQLIDISKASNGWEIHPKDITIGRIGDDTSNMISVLYELHSKNLGNFKTTAILYLDTHNLITKIDEVVEQL